MELEVVEVMRGDLLEAGWRLYAEAFEELRWTAVQRHLMHRSEFDEVMADNRIAKYLVTDRRGALRGLATYTNDLRAVPLISPDYFSRRWPHHFAERRIWYCGFVAVRSGSPNTGVFVRLVEAMYRVAVAQRGIIAMDFCRHNEEIRALSRVVQTMLHRLSGEVRSHRMDEQTYWLYEFPAA